jgi:hypothetical protein
LTLCADFQKEVLLIVFRPVDSVDDGGFALCKAGFELWVPDWRERDSYSVGGRQAAALEPLWI